MVEEKEGITKMLWAKMFRRGSVISTTYMPWPVCSSGSYDLHAFFNLFIYRFHNHLL